MLILKNESDRELVFSERSLIRLNSYGRKKTNKKKTNAYTSVFLIIDLKAAALFSIEPFTQVRKHELLSDR